ncbi:DUF6702 family protein [Frigoriflavimonas asaccharolytica]|uniref:Sporulation and spore germination protein n=1 Tax=Frigoriflavimonas asaccharolytica TaxID=2735899 RepID=A0A8J8GD28_9FLAO|nr:DUF6702 family protein [Frigoriflavimonas asaccharolytica]NRS93730.1 hypothetical protein [Frigoriflavimonas asaccharolytica]
MKKLSLLLILFLTITSFTKEVHPFHVGSVEFNFNKKSQTFEISEKFFIDDLENAVNKGNSKIVRFQDAKFKNEMNEALKNYALKNVKLKADGKILKLNYIGYQEENESVNIFLESEKITNPSKIETAVSMLYNLYDDQMNIIHLVLNGTRKSQKLTYPDQYFKNQF